MLGQKILVVDDEKRMRKLVKDFLVREDFMVLEAGDGEEAKAALLSAGKAFFWRKRISRW